MIFVACPCSQPGNFTSPRIPDKAGKTGTRRSPAYPPPCTTPQHAMTATPYDALAPPTDPTNSRICR